MDAKEFAKQYFDFWQQSVDQVMRDPHYAERMFDLMQQTQQLWKNADSFNTTNTNGYAGYTSKASASSTSGDAEAGAISTSELAGRLELCEQRLAVLEALVRQQVAANTSSRYPYQSRSGEPEEE